MSRLGRFGALVAFALLAAGVYAATVRGVADIRYADARELLTRSAVDRRLPDAGELSIAQASLREAMKLEPSNPLFVEQLARVHEMKAIRLERSDPQRREELRQALEQFRAAARMRPASPYVWAAIATVKYRLDEMDFEFYGALQRAERYGRWEPAIQLELADVGLAGWLLLPAQAKILTLDAVARAMPKQGKEVKRLAQSHGTLERVCAEEMALRRAPTGLCVKN